MWSIRSPCRLSHTAWAGTRSGALRLDDEPVVDVALVVNDSAHFRFGGVSETGRTEISDRDSEKYLVL